MALGPAIPAEPVADAVVLAQDPDARIGLQSLIEGQGVARVLCALGDLADVPPRMGGMRPELVIVDGDRDAANTMDRVRRVRRRWEPPPAVVAVGSSRDPETVRGLMRAGAAAYVLREMALGELAGAARAALTGRRYVTPQVGAELAVADEADPAGDLTRREIEVLRLLALGYTGAEIARALFVSERTVDAHRASLRRKLGATRRATLVQAAIERGLLSVT